MKLDVVVIRTESLDDPLTADEGVDGKAMSPTKPDRLWNFEVLESDRAELDGRIQQGYADSIVRTGEVVACGLKR